MLAAESPDERVGELPLNTATSTSWPGEGSLGWVGGTLVGIPLLMTSSNCSISPAFLYNNDLWRLKSIKTRKPSATSLHICWKYIVFQKPVTFAKDNFISDHLLHIFYYETLSTVLRLIISFKQFKIKCKIKAYLKSYRSQTGIMTYIRDRKWKISFLMNSIYLNSFQSTLIGHLSVFFLVRSVQGFSLVFLERDQTSGCVMTHKVFENIDDARLGRQNV